MTKFSATVIHKIKVDGVERDFHFKYQYSSSLSDKMSTDEIDQKFYLKRAATTASPTVTVETKETKVVETSMDIIVTYDPVKDNTLFKLKSTGTSILWLTTKLEELKLTRTMCIAGGGTQSGFYQCSGYAEILPFP